MPSAAISHSRRRAVRTRSSCTTRSLHAPGARRTGRHCHPSRTGRTRSVDAMSEVRVEGVDADVVVLRDEWGIPHVRAETARDAFFGQGFVQAEDRLGQLEYDRRRAHGRWAEVAGGHAVGFDAFARRCGLAAAAEREADALAPEARAVLDAFAAGVNAYLAAGSTAAARPRSRVAHPGTVAGGRQLRRVPRSPRRLRELAEEALAWPARRRARRGRGRAARGRRHAPGPTDRAATRRHRAVGAPTGGPRAGARRDGPGRRAVRGQQRVGCARLAHRVGAPARRRRPTPLPRGPRRLLPVPPRV